MRWPVRDAGPVIRSFNGGIGPKRRLDSTCNVKLQVVMLGETAPVPEVVLDYVRALAWPVVVAGFLFYFRQQVGGLFGRVTEVTSGRTSVKFAEQVSQLADDAAAIELGAETTATEAPEADESEPEVADPTSRSSGASTQLAMSARSG